MPPGTPAQSTYIVLCDIDMRVPLAPGDARGQQGGAGGDDRGPVRVAQISGGLGLILRGDPDQG